MEIKFILILAFILTAASPAIAHAASSSATHQSTIYYYNWGGYIADANGFVNNTVTRINGSWILQNVTQTVNPPSYSTQWIGIDGADNDELIQVGTESDSLGTDFSSG